MASRHYLDEDDIDISDTDAAEAEFLHYDALEELDDHDRADDIAAAVPGVPDPIDGPPYPAFVRFASEASDRLELGSDALLYVMAHGHTASVPLDALRVALTVAAIATMRRDGENSKTIAAVARAQALIEKTIAREAAGRATKTPAASPVDDQPTAGPMAPLQPVTPHRPTPGDKITIQF